MEHTSLKSLNINWLIFCFSFAQSPFCHLKTHQFLYNFFNNERKGRKKRMKKKQKNLMCKFIIFKGDEKSTISKEWGDNQYD